MIDTGRTANSETARETRANQQHRQTKKKKEATTNLEHFGVIVCVEVKGKHVGIHESLSTLAQSIDGILEELDVVR